MIPMPAIATERIARRAVEIIQTTGPKRTGRAASSIVPVWQTGIIGVDIPDSAAYYFDLNEGTTAHAMVELGGRVIPIRESDGTIAFRRAKASNIGAIPIINRSARDGRIVDNKPQWVYPAKPGLNFVQQALSKSITEWKRSLTSNDVINLLRQTEYRDAINAIVYNG